MVIQGFSFSAYLAIPVALSLFAEGEKIKVYLAENLRQVSTNKEIILSNRELISTNATPKTYYVSGTGNDENSGVSSLSAFRTIQKAADKHPTLEKISSDWKSWLDKQNHPTLTYVEPKLAAFVCEPMTYPLQRKLIKVGCSPQSLAETAFSDVSSNYWMAQFLEQLLQLGVIAGFLDGSFRPEKPVTYPLQEKLIKVECSPQCLTQTTFSDVSFNYWAAQFIQQLSQRDVIAGFPDGSFRPEEPVTRAQFAAIVNKAFQKTQERQPMNFTDVPSNYWAFSAIQQAYTIGFLLGYPGNRFEPNQAIPREQVLVSLANGLKYTAGDNTERTLQYFNDASNIASYARSPIAAATQKQIVVNYPNVKLLNPTATATRAQVAAFIYQALVSSNQASAINSPYIVVVKSTTSTPVSASGDFNHP